MKMNASQLAHCAALLIFVAAAADAFTMSPYSSSMVGVPRHASGRRFLLKESSTAVDESASETKTSGATKSDFFFASKSALSAGSSSDNNPQPKDDGKSAYEELGITADQLAMGINPEEVLEWIGT